MASKIKIGIFTASAVALAGALVLRLRQSRKKATPDPETSYIPNEAEQLWIPKGETFKGSVNTDCSGAYFFWDKEDVSGWQFDLGGYILHASGSILPTTDKDKSALQPGDVYELMAPRSDSGIMLYTNESNLIEKFRAV
tara:strand:+ start:629 stop:1045 length:417 start_codon:yes stop_codon:yes gene_type:complete